MNFYDLHRGSRLWLYLPSGVAIPVQVMEVTQGSSAQTTSMKVQNVSGKEWELTQKLDEFSDYQWFWRNNGFDHVVFIEDRS